MPGRKRSNNAIEDAVTSYSVQDGGILTLELVLDTVLGGTRVRSQALTMGQGRGHLTKV